MVSELWNKGNTAMPFNAEEVSKVARLARIGLTEEEMSTLGGDIDKILGWIESLKDVDISNTEPMVNGIDGQTPLRKDEANEGSLKDEVLSNAPDARDPFFTVPKVVE